LLHIQKHRPEGFAFDEVQSLSKIGIELYRQLKEIQKIFTYKTLRLPAAKLNELTVIIIEFAEDIFNDIGIWKSLEHYNKKLFNTPLPLSLPAGKQMKKGNINQNRLHHLLWNIYMELKPELILSPSHRDLSFLVEKLTEFLNRNQKRFPKKSSIKKFMNQSNQFGWDVKKKLIWLGCHSYLFRNSYLNYIQDNGGIEDISITDDFLCQNTTQWSGLGVIF